MNQDTVHIRRESRFGRSILFTTKKSADIITSVCDVSRIPEQYIRRQSIANLLAFDTFFMKSLQYPRTTGVMKAKLLPALSLLLVAGQFTGEH